VDIGREMRRYRAEPVNSPVPGEAPAVREPAADSRVAAEAPEPVGVDALRTQAGVAEARP
jgi:hypothetical protein